MNPQRPLYSLQRLSFCFRQHFPGKEQMQKHHGTEESKRIGATQGRGFCKYGKRPGDHGSHNPVRKTSERLTLCSHFIGKYFRDENPDDGSLRESKKAMNPTR